ncbi:MAG: helix-turn-helix transcriptional regulator [Lachnospiraceae bacterium]
MPKGKNQKLKILYLMRFLLEKTDENHSVNMAQIIAELEHNDISAERKSIYDDIAALQDFGIDIVGEKCGRDYQYKVVSREFETSELKLLVDAVQSSKFISAAMSNKLIKKLETLTSRHEAGKLQRQVYVAQRVKTDNEKIFHNVDTIYEAMGSNKQVRFRYFGLNWKKEREFHRNGDFYQVSPLAMFWEDSYYYLVAYDNGMQDIRHFRVDKMLNPQILPDNVVANDVSRMFNGAEYTRKHFGMFAGQDTSVTLLCDNSMAGVIFDRFGTDVMLFPQDGDRFKVNVRVSVSPQFFGWVFSMRGKVIISSPKEVADEMRTAITSQAELYRQI